MVTRARTEEDLVELWSRVVDPEYSRSIEQANDAGMDVVRMQASQFAALDARSLEVQQAYYLLPHSDQLGEPASGARHATTTLQVSRSAGDTGLGPRTLKAGVQLEARIVDSLGVERVCGYFEVAEDVTLEEGNLGPEDLPVRAVRPGLAGNVMAGTIEQFRARGTGVVSVEVLSTTTLADVVDVNFDLFNEGQRDQFVLVEGLGAESYPRLIANVSQGEPNVVTVSPALPVAAVGNAYTARVLSFDELFVVVQDDPAQGGRDAVLDGIGAERNKPRGAGETDDAYRVRLSRLDDTISPNAIVRLSTRILQPYGIRFHLVETREGLRGFVLDDSPLDTGTACAETDPWSGSVVLSENDATRFFMLCVSVPDSRFGDPSTPLDATNGGVNAYDAGGPGDGSAVTYNQVIALLWRSVNAARAAGINFAIVQDPDL